MSENRPPIAPDIRARAQGSPSIELTAAQRGIWYAQQLDPENPSYQIGQYLDLRGPIDERLLRIALTKTVADLDAMSLRIRDDGAGPFGVIDRPSPTANLLETVDLRDRGEGEARAAALDRMDSELATARDIVEGDLFATVLFRIADEQWLLFQRVHHVLLDGYSAVIGLRYLAGAYSRLVKSAPGGILGAVLSAPISYLAARTASPLPSLPELQTHLEEYRNSEQFTTDAEYWRGQFAADTEVTGLEGTASRVARRVERASAPIPDADAVRLRALGRDMPKTAVGLVALYLSKMTGQSEVSLGLPVTARRGPIAKQTPSMLSSILPLRVDVSANQNLAEVIVSAGDAVRGAVAHQQFPIGELAPGHGATGPSVNLLPVIDDLTFGRARGTVTILSTGPVRDLSVVISGLTSDAAEPTLQLEGDADLYSARTLAEHAARLLELLTQVLDEPASTAVTAATVVSDAEATRLLARGAGAEIPIGQESVLTAFADIADVRGSAPAVIAADGSLSFAEVQDLSSRLAHLLVARGVGAGSTVAVRIERSKYLPVLVLAALKSGGVYVPLDPEYPIDRVSNMIEDASPELLLTSPGQAERDHAAGANWTVPALIIDENTAAEWPAVAAGHAQLPIPPATDLAYVVFTSGSTGRPKGVGVERLALRNLFEHHRAEMFDPAQARLGRPARVAHTAGLSFDAAWDPLLWLFAGHELHLVDDDVRRDPQRLAAYLSEREIDSIETTPSFAEALIAAGLFTQRRYPTEIALGGEAVGPELWKALASRSDVYAVNLYGPTETTVDSLIAPITEGRDPHLGTSVRNTRHYLLDAALSPVPDGAVGELYLAGANVAAGYIGQPGLSAERFLADPFTADGTRMYRTGDVVRRRRNGSLRFLGRIDEQVKIRGYRVELSEVESALRRCDGVTGAAAVVQGSGASARIIGYVTGDADLSGLSARVKTALTAELPAYMVPGSVLALAELPMTPNGKLDRRALPEPSAVAADRVQQPRTPEECIVVEAFINVLGVPSIGVDEDFFAAGGHSLLATQLASLLTERLERQVTVRDVFERPTPAELADLAATSAGTATALLLQPMPHDALVPVSPTQRRLWFLNSLDPTSSAYNIPIVLHLEGDLDEDALRAALRDVVARHEPLRTVFPYVDGEPQQHILDAEAGGPTLIAVDVPGERLEAILHEETLRPFDVTTEVPLRSVLLRTSPTNRTLVVTMHHIAADGWSLAPFAADLSQAYRAHAAGGEALPDLPVSYADYTLWQRASLGSPEDPQSAISAQLDFWRRALADAPEEIELPRDRPRGQAPSDIGHLAFEIDAERHAQLRAAAQEHRTSLFILLHAAVATALGQHGAGTDIVIGTPVAGRSDPQLNDLIGFFVNTVPLRTSLSGNPTLDELIERVRASNTEAYAHQDVPFDAIVDALRPSRVADRHPVFQVLLTLQNTAPARLDLDGVEVTVPGQVTSAGVKTDLMLDFATPGGDDGALHAALAYDRALFDASTIAGMRDSVDRLLGALVERPERRLSDIATVEASDRERITRQSRGPAREVSGTVLDALDAQVGAHPNETALIDDAESLTFVGAGARIDAVARALLLSGVHRGDRVAVALSRSADAIIIVLAAQRAGAIAVPIDIEYPDARVTQILEAAAPELLIATDTLRLGPLAEAAGTAVVDPATLLERDRRADPASVLPQVQAEDAAYLVFTSGTTGAPKGVQVPHSALMNVFSQHREAMIEPFRAQIGGRTPRVLHVAGLGFDAAWDPILWLAAGSTLVVATDATRRDAAALVDALDTHAIDVLETTPSFVRQLASSGLLDRAQGRTTPLLVAVGGEAISPELWQSLAAADGIEAWNLYGPSEFTVDSVVARVQGDAGVRIGHPITNVRARVLDEYLREVPDGVTGELYLSGASEAHGYRGRAAETASAFIADPSGTGSRMYRTGDLVRRHHDGSLEYLRRDDDQVKLRGYRIELADVERALERADGVTGAVARVDAPAGPDSARIVAWVATSGAPDDTRSGDRILATAREQLPAYMVPTTVLTLDRIPLTPNGKVDVAALPAPASHGRSRAPESDAEQLMCTAFATITGADSVGMDDDFFALGGHSLLAVALIGEIRERFGTAPAVRAVFDAPTPAGLLDHTLQSNDDRADADAASASEAHGEPLSAWVAAHPRGDDSDAPVSPGQARLWFINRLDSTSGDYNVVLGAELAGDLDVAALSQSVDDLVARHEILRTIYPEVDGAPVQRVHAATSGVLQLGRIDATVGFELTRELPLRAGIEALGEQRWRLQLVVHHIATDGASLAPMLRDLAAAYAARTGGASADLAPLPGQFGDYARQLAATRNADREDADLHAWVEHLSGAPDELVLPADGARERRATQPAAQVAFAVPGRTAEALSSFAAGIRATDFHGWLGALSAFLMRTGAGSDLVIGTPSAGRPDPDLTPLVGFFVNTLPVRLQLGDEASLADAIATARSSALFGIDHEHVPFERIVEAVGPERALGRHPLFQTLLTVEQPHEFALELPGVTVTPEVSASTGAAKADLSFTLCPSTPGAEVLGTLEFNSALFSEAAAHGLVQRFVAFLDSALDAPDAPIMATDIAGTPARLPAWSSNRAELGSAELANADANTAPVSVLAAFDATIARDGLQTALVTAEGSVTFTELAQRATEITAGLRAAGVGSGSVVATRLPRSFDTIAALFGIWRAGAVAMPIDPEYPPERVDAMLAAADPALVIDGDVDAALRTAERDRTEFEHAETAHPRVASLDDPAYLIFTSGTTGEPKGVQVPHRALASLLRNHRATLLPDSALRRARFAHTTGVGFDAAMDPVLWLAEGHEIHLVGDETRRDPEALLQYFAAQRITAWETTPSYVEAVSRQTGLAEWLDAREVDEPFTLLLGGEAVTDGMWQWARERRALRAWNLYGPTEVGVDSMLADVAAASQPTLGSTTRDTVGYVLDRGLRPVPVGSIGELWLAGAQLAHGYLGRAAATADRFVADPFARDGSRMYRTGDLVAVRDPQGDETGRVVSLGRSDAQVKIRGHRVEPDELRLVLEAQPGVERAVVLPVPQGEQTVLGAWVVAAHSDDQSALESDLREAVQGRVPEYMVPSAIAFIDRVPLTPNGKLDRAALPDLHASGGAGRVPETPSEVAVAAAYAEALGVDDVRADDSFFALGGHSFIAQPVIRAVNAALGSMLPVQAVFQAPTVAGLAALAERGEGDIAASLQPILPLRPVSEPGATRTPLFAVHPASGVSWKFAGLLAHLDASQPLYGLQLPGITPDVEALSYDALPELLDEYVAAMCSVQPEGPYRLIGFSFGGRLAQHLAAHLQSRGAEVELLAILDAYPTEHSAIAGVDGGDAMWRAFLDANDVAAPEFELDAASTRRVLAEAGNPAADLPDESIERLVHGFLRLGALLDETAVPTFTGDLHVFEATVDVPGDRPTPQAWEPFTRGSVTASDVPARHSALLSDDAVRAFAPQLERLIADAQARRTNRSVEGSEAPESP